MNLHWVFYLPLLLWYAQSSTTPAPPTPPPHRLCAQGVYSFGLAKNFTHSMSLTLPYIAGMSATFNWRDLEPEEGQYTFDALDDELLWAEQQHRKLNIILYAGNKSPEWIYDHGVDSIQWQRRWKEDQAEQNGETHHQETAPVFWDSTYLSYWKRFVTTLAQHLPDHPPALGYVLITGATPKDFTTGTVIRYDDDWEQILEAGYTFDKHYAAWTGMIDHYHQLFPKQPLVLALGPLRPGGANYTLSKALMEYIINRHYHAVSFMGVTLNDTWFLTSRVGRSLRALMAIAKSQGYTFGHQLVYSVHRNARFDSSDRLIQDMGTTLNIALNDGASWIEIWHDDIILPKYKLEGTPNETYQEAIMQAAAQLKPPPH